MGLSWQSEIAMKRSCERSDEGHDTELKEGIEKNEALRCILPL